MPSPPPRLRCRTRGWTGCGRSCPRGGRPPRESVLRPRRGKEVGCEEALRHRRWARGQKTPSCEQTTLPPGVANSATKNRRGKRGRVPPEHDKNRCRYKITHGKRPSPQTQGKTTEKHKNQDTSHARASTGTPADSLWIMNRRSRTSSTTLSGVDAPEVTPMVTGPVGRKPSTTCSCPSEER